VDVAYESAITTLLWSEIDDNGEPFDGRAGDVVDPDDGFYTQVRDFVRSNWGDIQDMSPDSIGHNFVLSKNHHGTGFWDRGLGELGDRLHGACDSYGETYLFLGDDNRVYIYA
jgi:hypothetical protein